MADTTIGGIATAVTTLAGADLIEVEQGGTTKKATGYNVYEMITDKGADVASAGTTTLGDGSLFHITGTTTITAIAFTNSWDGRVARLVFDGALTITYNATSLILPGRASIKTGPGDSATIVIEGGNVRMMQFERAAQLQNTNPFNASIANQSPAASATTLLTDSVVSIPDSGVQIRSRFLWHVVLTKTAAGTVAPVILVKVGTAGTTADGTVLTFTFPSVGTAVADTADIWIEFVVVGPLTSACVPRGTLCMTRTQGLTATGWLSAANAQNRITGTTANFNATTTGLKASLALTLGASYVVTVEQVCVETYNV
jgi:hypothetical protein